MTSSTNLGTIYYTIDARTGQLVADLNRADHSMDNTRRTAGALRSAMSGLAVAVAGAISLRALASARELGESYNILRAQITRLSETTDHAAATYQKLVDVSSSTGASLKVTVGLWQGLTGSLKESGATNTEILRLVETIQKIGTVGGSSAEDMSNALRQFGQSMAGGIVRAEEFNSVIEGMPELARQMAKGMGIPFSQLRTMMLEGKLTATEVQKALVKQQAEVDAAFAAMPRTVAAAANAITTEFGTAMADLDNFYGVSVGIAGGFDAIASSIKGLNVDDVSSALDKAAVAAELFAAVLIGRVSMATAGYLYQQYATVTATLARIKVDNIAAAGSLRRAQAEQTSALAALRVAQAEYTAAEGTAAHTFALTALNSAQARYAAAAIASAQAQNVVNAAVTRGTVAFGALRSVMSFLGGPLGVVLLAATAIYAFASSTDTAKSSVDALNGSLDKLTFAQLERSANKTKDKISDLESDLTRFQNRSAKPSKALFETDAGFKKRMDDDKASVDDAAQSLVQYRARLDEIVKKQAELTASKGQEPLKALTPDELAASKVIEDLKKQEALTRKVGVERAKLAATQKLGAGAEPAQIKQVEALAESIYNLEQAQKSQKSTEKKGLSETAKLRKKAEEDEIKGNEDNAKTIADLNEAIYQTSLNTEQLAARKAELSLNSYASPVDIELVKSLGIELERLNEIQAKKKALGTPDEAKKKVVGEVNPLTGGEFDDQSARYKAEAEAEQQRYADQLARFEEAKQLQVEVAGGYHALEEQMAKTHADRMAQIEMAKNSTMLSSGQNLFSSMSGATAAFAGEQSAAYKVMFAASKAFAIADSIVKIQTGLAGAAALPFPANLPAMAAVAAATAGIVSTIASTSIGRAQGGPVQAGGSYRINETGAPEIFNAANGRQYMMPNQRGEVVSNADATSGGSGSAPPVININNYSGQGATTASKFSEADKRWVVDVIVGDMQGGGSTGKSVNQITGTKRVGS